MNNDNGLEKIDGICKKLKDIAKELEQAVTEEEEKQLSEEEYWRRYWRQREFDRQRRQRSLPAGHTAPVENNSHAVFYNTLRSHHK
jgi:hypothetical protein